MVTYMLYELSLGVRGSNLDLPTDVNLASSQDLYWNIPTISHQFNEKLDRDAVLQTIKGLNGIINACLSGSKVIGYTHKHAEGLSCEQETILEKV